MKVIGITGGIASGKSFVARCFEKLGCQRIDADKISHEVLHEREVIAAVRGHWGPTVLDDDGQVDRKRLGQIVFEDGGRADSENCVDGTARSMVGAVDRLKVLESILHPRVCARVTKQIGELKQQYRKNAALCQAVVLDAPVMFKTELVGLCDEIVFVDSPDSVRQSRAAQRGWGDGELERRELRQLPVAEKKRRSTAVIDNSGSQDDTMQQIRELMSRWSLADLGNTKHILL